MSRAVPKAIKTVNELMAGWEMRMRHHPNLEVPVDEDMLKLTLDVIARVAFDFDFGSVTAETTSDAPLYDAFKTIMGTCNRRG